MSAGTFIFLLAVAILLCVVWPTTIHDQTPAPEGRGHGRWLAGLVDVDYDDDLVLVTPRGVELPYSPEWDLDDVMDTLAEVDAL